MKASGVCDAHGILYDNVTYMRKKQDALVETVGGISDNQIKMSASIESIQSTQAQILKMVQKKKWTPGKVIAYSATVFGSGSAFPAIVQMIIQAVKK